MPRLVWPAYVKLLLAFRCTVQKVKVAKSHSGFFRIFNYKATNLNSSFVWNTNRGIIFDKTPIVQFFS